MFWFKRCIELTDSGYLEFRFTNASAAGSSGGAEA